MSGLATVACLADLESVIKALMTSRILIQFVGQIATVFYLQSQGRAPTLTYRMPLFPLPALVALAGWLFIFFTSETPALIYGDCLACGGRGGVSRLGTRNEEADGDRGKRNRRRWIGSLLGVYLGSPGRSVHSDGSLASGPNCE